MSNLITEYPNTARLFGTFYKSLSGDKFASLYVSIDAILRFLLLRKKEDNNRVLKRLVDESTFHSYLNHDDIYNTSLRSSNTYYFAHTILVNKINTLFINSNIAKISYTLSQRIKSFCDNFRWDAKIVVEYFNNRLIKSNSHILKRSYLPDDNYNFIYPAHPILFKHKYYHSYDLFHGQVSVMADVIAKYTRHSVFYNMVTSFYKDDYVDKYLKKVNKLASDDPDGPIASNEKSDDVFYYISEKDVIKYIKYIELILKTSLDNWESSDVINYVKNNIPELNNLIKDEKAYYSHLVRSLINNRIKASKLRVPSIINNNQNSTVVQYNDNEYINTIPTIFTVANILYSTFGISLFKKTTLGRVVRNISNYPVKDDEIEQLINIYKRKPVLEKSDRYDIEEVRGDLISFYYPHVAYNKNISGSEITTTLLNSCMRHFTCKGQLKLYTDNKDIISMIIVKNKSNTLLEGRALVFLDKRTGKKYVGRIYYNNHDVVRSIYSYCEEKEYLNISNSNNSFFGYVNRVNIKLDKWRYSIYPFIDDFNGVSSDGYLYFYDLMPKSTINIRNTDSITSLSGGGSNYYSDLLPVTNYKELKKPTNNNINGISDISWLYSSFIDKFVHSDYFKEFNFIITANDKKINLLPSEIPIAEHCKGKYTYEEFKNYKYDNNVYILTPVK